MEIRYPEKINIYNLPMFFNIRSTSTSQVFPGNLIQFNYSSPTGVHDKKPLVYVLNTEGDRVWGINLHYRFNLIEGIVDSKKKLVTESYNKIKEINIDTKPTQKQLSNPIVPSLAELKDNYKQQEQRQQQLVSSIKPNIPIKLLEEYTLSQTPENILRNYLYTRISGLQKLIFKV